MPKQPYINTFEDPALRKATVNELRNTAPATSEIKSVKTTSNVAAAAVINQRSVKSEMDGSIISTAERIVKTPDGTVVIVNTDKEVVVNTFEEITEQKYINNIEGTSSLCAGTVNSLNEYNNIVSNVCKLGFDTDSGFEVTNLGNGLAKIGMNSTFKCWEVNGSSGLIACGLDTVNFVAGSGVTITSCNSAVPKSLTISATGTSGVASLNSLTGALTLSAGNNTSIGVSGNTLTLCNTYSGVNSLNSLTGALTLSAGNNTSIGVSGNTLTLCNTYSGVNSLNSLTGALTLSAGNNISIGTSGNTLTVCSTSVATPPGGSNCQFQYNNSGSFAGACGLTYNNSTGALGMTRIDVPANQSLQINVSSPNSYWYSLYGDISLNFQDDYSSQVVYDSLGNSYIVGADGDNGYSPFLVKYDKNGSILWQKIFTEVNNYYKTGDAVAVDSSNNVYCLIGKDDATNDITIFKLTSTGTLVWQTTYTATDYLAGTDLVVDNSGNVYACLYYSDTEDRQLILKVDNTGSIQWQKALSGGNNGYPQGITLDSAGNVIIVGQMYNGAANNLLIAKYNISGVLQWQQEFLNPDGLNYNVSSGQITTDSSNNIYITGSMFLSAGANKIYLTKLDSSGNLIWQTNLDFNGFQSSFGVALDSSNNVYISGSGNTSLGSGYFIMAKFDNSGVIQWQRIFGAGNESQYYYWSVKTIDVYNDSYIVTGYTNTVPVQNFNAEAITFQLPTDGSLTGTYGNFTYQASNFTIDNNTFTSQSGTAVETIGLLVANPGVYTVVAGANSNTLMKISGGNNSLTLSSTGTLDLPNYSLPYVDGLANQVIVTNGSGTLSWQTSIPAALNNCGSLAIRNSSNLSITGCNNFVVGDASFTNNAFGCGNISMGYCSLYGNIFGNNNIAIGCNASTSNTSGYANISIGTDALHNNQTGSFNIAIGACSQNCIMSCIGNNSCYNISIGTNAMGIMCTLYAFATPINPNKCNIAIGNCSMYGSCNVYGSLSLGQSSYTNVNWGQQDVALGHGTMYNSCCTLCNVMVGQEAGATVYCGQFNVGIGQFASSFLCNYCYGVGIGAFALSGNANGINNIGIGQCALHSGGGNSNIAIGNSSGLQLGKCGGTQNIAIGSCTMTSNTTGCDSIAIGTCALNLYAGIPTHIPNIAIGCKAGACITTGNSNTIIGSLTGTAGLVCTVLIGAGTCERIKVDNTGLYINGACWCSGGSSVSPATPTTLGTTYALNQTSYCNTFVGYCAGNVSNTGTNNIAIGCGTLSSDVTGGNNIAIGVAALKNQTGNTNQYGNIAIGSDALYSNTTGYGHIAIGQCALKCATSIYGNVAIGFEAGKCVTTGCGLIAIGYGALANNLTGDDNIAIGLATLASTFCGTGNIAIGTKAMNYASTGACNIAVGSSALGCGCGSIESVAIGTCAMYSGGIRSIAIGYCSGTAIATGANNTIIGSLSGTAGLVCTVLIGAGTCERIKVDNNGLCINGVPFTGGSGVTSLATSGSGLGFSLSGGPITTTGTVTLTVPTATSLSTCLQGDGLCNTSVGFRILPQNSQSADYVLVAADSGKHLLHPSTDANARTFTIPANSSVAYPIGTSITFINETSQVLTINITSDTMYLAGSGLTGSRTLGQYGVATAIKTGTTTWYISGTGLT